MDAVTISFLALLIVASGGIAYFADWLGRKLGKKRLTFGRLRPRQTAALGTVLSGILISTFTILIVMAVSSDVRTWVLKGNQAIREYQATLKLLQDARSQLAAATSARDSANKARDQAQAEKGKLEEDVQSLRADREKLQSQLASTKGDLAKATASLQSASARLAAAQQRANQAEGQLVSTQKNLQSKKSEYTVALNRFNEVSKQTADLTFQLTQTEEKLESAETELAARQAKIATLDAKIGDLSESLKNTQELLIKATDDLTKTTEDLEQKRTELSQLQDRLRETQGAVALLTASLQGNLQNSRLRPMILSSGEEMARIQLDANSSPERVRASLEAALRTANNLALERGAKAGRPGAPVASLRDQMVEHQTITAEQQKDAIVQAASNVPEQSVIIVTALWNVFEEEDVPLMAIAYRNPMVYREGQIVAETKVDGNRSDDVIIKQLTEFLTDKLKKKALADRMIPAQGREESFGRYSLEDLFALARDIKETRRQVRLVAVAKQDTRAADPLRVDLRIR